jgi:hypothetical protein
MTLTSYPYHPHLPVGEAVYSLLAAKYAAERSAEGVGEETIAMVLKPGKSVFTGLSGKMVKTMREKWEALSRIPEGAADDIMADFKTCEENPLHYVDVESGTLSKPVYRIVLSKKPGTA